MKENWIRYMTNKSHLHYAVLNMGVSGVSAVLKIILGFISRTIFIHVLGTEFLGLNGLLTSVLVTLSLAEMGVGNAIVYSLYHPISVGDWAVVRSMMRLYQTIYRILAGIVLVIGITLIPFLPIIAGKPIKNLTVYYCILLFNSVVSYLLTYNRSLIIANECNYIVSTVDFLTYLATMLLQITTLFLWKNYSVYLVLQVFFTVIGNVVLTIIVRRKYYWKFENIKSSKVPKDVIQKLKKNVIGTFANKVGDVAVNGTVNILIAMFLNLITVGLYSNYQLVISSIQSVMFTIANAMTSTIGNIAALNKDSESRTKLFFKHQFMTYTMAFFASAFILGSLPYFIKLWIGDKFVMPNYILIIMVEIFVINSLRFTGLVFIDAYGLAYEQRIKPFLEAAVNLSLSIIFLAFFKMGIEGILIASALTSFFVATTYEAYVVFRYGFRKSVYIFYKKYFKVILEITINLIIVYFLTHTITIFHLNDMELFILSILLVFGVTSLSYYLFNFKRAEFKELLGVLIRKINGRDEHYN